MIMSELGVVQQTEGHVKNCVYLKSNGMAVNKGVKQSYFLNVTLTCVNEVVARVDERGKPVRRPLNG